MKKEKTKAIHFLKEKKKKTIVTGVGILTNFPFAKCYSSVRKQRM